MEVYKQPASYVGTPAIMEMFDTFSEDNPVWSLWYSDREKAFEWNNADYEKGKRLFEQAITALENSGNCRTLYVKFYPDLVKGVIVKSTPYTAQVMVQACESPDIDVINGIERYAGNNAIAAVLKRMDERIAAMEGDGVDAAEVTGVDKVMGYVSTLMENPATSQVIQGIIGKIFEFLNPPAPTVTAAINGTAEPATGKAPVSENQPMAMSEVDGEKLNAALTRLQYHCELDNDLTRLADMAESNPATFKMMLGMLRTQTV